MPLKALKTLVRATYFYVFIFELKLEAPMIGIFMPGSMQEVKLLIKSPIDGLENFWKVWNMGLG